MFIAKNNNLIILARNTREELEEALQFMVYTSIEETEENYILYNGQYLTQEEIDVLERARKDAMTLTPADVWRALYKAKQMRSTDLLALIEEKMTGVDMNLVEIEFGASTFYRGAKLGSGRLFDVIGGLLNYTSDDMDILFLTKELPEKEVEQEEVVEEAEETVEEN